MPYDPYAEEQVGQPQVNPQDVQAFLGERNTQEAPPAPAEPRVIPLPVTLEQLAGADTPPAQASETPKLPMDPKFEPSTQTEQTTRQWALELPGLQLEVPEADRVSYLKATLLDEPVVWEIEVAGTVRFQIRSLTAIDQDLLFAALAKDVDDKVIANPAAYSTWLQRYCTHMQILSLRDTADKAVFKTFNTFHYDDSKQVPEEVDRLRHEVQERRKTLNLPAFDLTVAALRVFEGRMTVCASNLHNASFWKPAS